MTSEEAKETILEYQRTKDEVLWEKIYSNYEPIIKKMTKRVKGYSFYEDAFQEGVYGLWYAINNYNGKNNPITYIYASVFGRVQKEIYKSSGYTYYKSYKSDQVSMNKEYTYEKSNNRSPITKEIVRQFKIHDAYDIEIDRIKTVLFTKPERLVLEEIIKNDNGSRTELKKLLHTKYKIDAKNYKKIMDSIKIKYAKYMNYKLRSNETGELILVEKKLKPVDLVDFYNRVHYKLPKGYIDKPGISNKRRRDANK